MAHTKQTPRPVCLGDQLDDNFEFVLLLDLECGPDVSFWIGLCIGPLMVPYVGFMTVFFVSFPTTFYASFHFDYAPVTFPSTHYRAYLSCFAELWQSLQHFGRQFVELPHKFAGLIPFRFQEHLQPQQRMSAFAAYPEGRRGSPGLPFSLLLLHKRRTLVLYLRGTCYGTHLLFLFGRCGTPPGAWGIDPPQNWVPSCCLLGPSSTYVLPLFFLMMWHARTFRVE